VTYNIKNVFSLVKKAFSLKHGLDKIIEEEFEKAIESLYEFGIIEYIKSKYEINYIEPKLEILEDTPSIIGGYSEFVNEIKISKKSIEREVDEQLKFLGYKEIKRSISDIQGIKYLNKSYNLIFLYPLYIDKRDIRKAIAEAIIRSAMFHEIWHSIDSSILNKLVENSTIKEIDHLITIFYNPYNRELRASAFEVVMYYLVNGFYKYEEGYRAAYNNIPICRDYIEKRDKLEKNEYMNKYVPYDLGFCYGGITIAANKLLLKENIYNIIEDIVHLDKERAIDVIKLYGDNLEMLLYD
jgi:hypothetical protein